MHLLCIQKKLEERISSSSNFVHYRPEIFFWNNLLFYTLKVNNLLIIPKDTLVNPDPTANISFSILVNISAKTSPGDTAQKVSNKYNS